MATINVKVSNIGLDASDSVTVYNKLPKNLKLQSANYKNNFKSGKWNMAVPAKKSYTLQMKFKVNKKGTHKFPVYVNNKLSKNLTIKGV